MALPKETVEGLLALGEIRPDQVDGLMGVDPSQPYSVSMPGVPAEDPGNPFAEINAQTQAAAENLGIDPSQPYTLGAPDQDLPPESVTPQMAALFRAENPSEPAEQTQPPAPTASREDITIASPVTQQQPPTQQTGAGFGYGRQLRGIANRQKSAAEELATIRQVQSAEQAGVLEGLVDDQLAASEKMAQAYEVFKADYEAQQQSLKEAQEDALYWNISGDDRKQYQATLNDPNASNQDRAIAQAKLEKAQEIDPNRAFGGAGGQVMAAIAMAMGAFGSAFTGGPNHAANIISRAIDRDIKAQLEKRSAKRALIGDFKSSLEENIRRFGNEQQAVLAEGIGRLNLANTKIKQIAAKHEGAEQMAAVQQVTAGIDQEVLQLHQQFNDAARSMAMKKAQGGAKQLPATQAADIGEMEGAREILKNVGQAFSEKTGWFSILAKRFPGTSATKYEDAREAAAGMISSMVEGRSTDEDVERYKRMLPDAGDSKARAVHKLDQARKFIESRIKAKAKALGGSGYDVSGVTPPPTTQETNDALGAMPVR